MGKGGLQSESFPPFLFPASVQKFFMRQRLFRSGTVCRTEQSRSRTFEKMASVRYPLLHLMFGFLLGLRSLPAQPGIQPGKAEFPADLRSLEGLSVLGEPDSLYILRPFYLPGTFYKFQPDTPAKQVIVELFPCFGMLQSCLDGIEDFVFHPLRSMEFLHVGLALALGVCQPVFILKQFCGDFITLVIALGRDYLAVISDAVIDQVAVQIVRVMVSYQNKLSVFYPHQLHVFPGYFSHKFICQQCLVFRLEAQCDVSDRLFYLRIKLPLVVETVRYFPDIS